MSQIPEFEINQDLLKIFENTDQYKKQIKPFKEQITDENSRQ
jgi:hypothetical protein